MSRSGYSDDFDDKKLLNLYRATVERTIKGRRGQAFLQELATAMDAMPEKVLIRDELIDEDGGCCAIGVVCKARKLDVSKVDCDDPEAVGKLVGISRSMAAEIEYENDEYYGSWIDDTPEKRWKRMRKWVAANLKSEKAELTTTNTEA